MSKPEPFVHRDVDISGMHGFLLNVQQLFASELWALSTGDEFKAAVALWGRAWLQVPAGSLPNDERVLAAFSGAGARWKKVRAIALRGFIECSDGRLYHKVLCDDVMTAWEKRVAFRKRTEAATIARRQRNDQRNDDVTESQIQLQITVTEDSKKEISSLRSDSAPVPRPKACRLPDDWYPNVAGVELARKTIGEVAGDRELEKFRDFWRANSGKDGAKLDWDATWRNWIRNADDRRPTQRAGPPQSGRSLLAQIATGNFPNVQPPDQSTIIELNARPVRSGDCSPRDLDPQSSGTGSIGRPFDFGQAFADRR
jgi:hypothetical protein